jgi:hypothetical protein
MERKESSMSDIYCASNIEDFRLKPCEHCQSEGRIIRAVSRHWGMEPKEEDCGECPVCEGTGMEMIEVESIDLDDLCRNGGCQYGMAPEYTCRHECQYKRANSKQETVSDERDGAVARWRLECEDATEKFAKAMYLRGVHDGLKHGPIVTRWDIPPHLIRDWIKDTGIALSPPSRDGK